MFNVQGNNNAARYQQYLLRLMEAQERRMRPGWAALLQKAYVDAAKEIEHGQSDMSQVITKHRIASSKMLAKNYREILAYFGTFAFDQFKKSQSKGVSPSYAKSMEDVYWQSVKQWASVSALSKSKKIAKTTRALIHRIVRSGMEQGLSNNDIVAELRSNRKTFNKVRATMIVRTETHSSASKAINQAVKSTGYKHQRVWRATLDDRIRGRSIRDKFNHLKANKQSRDMEEPFDVSGEKLDFPGDPKASAGNIVNCRCVLTYHTKRL